MQTSKHNCKYRQTVTVDCIRLNRYCPGQADFMCIRDNIHIQNLALLRSELLHFYSCVFYCKIKFTSSMYVYSSLKCLHIRNVSSTATVSRLNPLLEMELEVCEGYCICLEQFDWCKWYCFSSSDILITMNSDSLQVRNTGSLEWGRAYQHGEKKQSVLRTPVVEFSSARIKKTYSNPGSKARFSKPP